MVGYSCDTQRQNHHSIRDTSVTVHQHIYSRCSLTVAAPLVLREDEARLAGALEAAGGVGAGAKLADVGLHLTLVDI